MQPAPPVDDPRLADFTSLTDMQLRRVREPAEGLFIAEGAKVIARALAAGYPLRGMLLAPKWLPSMQQVLTAAGWQVEEEFSPLAQASVSPASVSPPLDQSSSASTSPTRPQAFSVVALRFPSFRGLFSRKTWGVGRKTWGVARKTWGVGRKTRVVGRGCSDVPPTGVAPAAALPAASALATALPAASAPATALPAAPAPAAAPPAAAPSPTAPLYLADDATLQQVTGYAVHRGALASFARRPLPSATQLLETARRVVILEDTNDHTNLGAIFRSAAALGIDAILLSPRCADPLYRRTLKVSMGAVFALPYTTLDTWPEGLAQVRHAGFRLLALTPNPDATPLPDLRLAPDQRCALLLGAEGPGLTPTALAAGEQVRIPMPVAADPLRAQVVDSLNVAAATAIACYALDQLKLS